MTNFFYLDKNPVRCARYYCDKHVNKIMIEIAQLLSQVHHLYDRIPPYKKCLLIKPDLAPFKWVQESQANYLYCAQLAYALLNEYKYRYNKTEHKCEKPIIWLLKHIPPLPNSTSKPTKFYMTDNVKIYNEYFKPLDASRFSYVDFKCRNDRWTRRSKPKWFDIYASISKKERKKLIKKILVNVKEKLPELAIKNRWKVKRYHSFLRICYDNLFNGNWKKKTAVLTTMFDSTKPLLYQLGYGHLLKVYETTKKLFDTKQLIELNEQSLIYRNKN